MDLRIDSKEVNQNEETENDTIEYEHQQIDKRSNTPTTSNQNKRDIDNLIRPHICEICSKKFRFKSWLDRHKTTHTGENRFKCIYCGKSFRSRFSLQGHVLSQHQNDDRYKENKHLYNVGVTHTCEKCDKKFKNKSDLIKHDRMHNDERPFECKYCGFRFIHKHYLDRHVNARHPSSNDFDVIMYLKNMCESISHTKW